MDNKKIGKLIASLRRKNGLTQQELGDKVGVGFRAVSKWERGINLPDIGIINDLSKTLGISSDELLSGELKKEDKPKEKKKLSLSIKITISVIFSIIVIFTSLFIYNKNKTYTYNLVTTNQDEYFIEGQASFRGDKITIIINKLYFKDKYFSLTEIKNYEYKLVSNDTYLFGYGNIETYSAVDEKLTIKKMAEEFRINCVDKTHLTQKDVLNNKIYLIMNFTDINNQEIIREIEISLYPPIEKENK